MSNLQEPYNSGYKNISKSFSAYENRFNISYRDFIFIIKSFLVLLSESIVNDGKVYKLPYGLGSLGVRRRPTYGRGVFDYELFKKEGIKVWKKNMHSGMYSAQVFWDKRSNRYTLPDYTHVFKLRPCRDLARYLSQQIKNNNSINKYYDY